jgi:serine/threonine protein kinase
MKAANVLLTGSRRVCIADFGLSEAKDRSKSMTRSAQGSGSSGGGMTVAWSAPELLNGEPKSFATDVFALGVTLWETFMRATPYKGMPDVVRRLRGGPSSCLGLPASVCCASCGGTSINADQRRLHYVPSHSTCSVSSSAWREPRGAAHPVVCYSLRCNK